ncbi:MAG TPA: rhomboid family intramembrane serine protease [Gammaproteobacteria bacterium]|nr:rhomboid family intramembrane serine protease [Gammaproteobacteria bacterium]
MLILPLARKPDWRRPPIITLLLVAACAAVFFGLQQGDARHYRQAVAFYLDSPLPDIEFPRYIAYLEAHDRAGRARALRRALAQGEGAGAQVLARMQADGRFMERLRSGEVVTPDHPAFAQWRRARAEFEQRLERVTIQRLGFVPAHPTALAAVAHMFLHAGIGHLVGNMIFLVLVGYVVEAVVGRLLFLGVYLLGGLIAAAAFAAVYSNSAVPLVGASGAISGLMGAYVVLFGLRRIPFFYSLGFYFDFARAPAILLLPAWIGWEAYQLLFGGTSGVAYMAHIGGLAGGALLGVGLRLTGQVDMAFLDRDEQQEQDTADMDKGLEHLANLELDAARERFRALLRRHPDHREALAKLYTVARYQPDSEEYHRLARRIFALPGNDPAVLRFKRETFRDYVTTAKPRTRFDPDQFLDLTNRFATGGYPEDAATMATSLLKQGQATERLPRTLMLVARGLARKGEAERARRFMQTLVEQFPDSDEAWDARELLVNPDALGGA